MPGGHGEGSNSGGSSKNKPEIMKEGMAPGEVGGLKKPEQTDSNKVFKAEPLYRPDGQS